MPLGKPDRHTVFKRWSQDQGVQINGIQASEIPGKGIGIVAIRSIKKGEEILRAPVSVMITVDTDPTRKVKLGKEKRVHARMAAALTLQIIGASKDRKANVKDTVNASVTGDEEAFRNALKIWLATWPTQADFDQYMPLHWSKQMQKALPSQTQRMLAEQTTKFREHWESYLSLPDAFDSHFPTYKYIWSIVNSRCFYWERPHQAVRRKRGSFKRTKLHPQIDSEDCMALVPFADYFNHASSGCEFKSDPSGCWIISDRDYALGEEVVLSYGKHDNDMLLVEYGFTMDDNPYDKVKLDDLFDRSRWKGRSAQMDLLDSRGYMGNLTLDNTGVCFRTEVALHSLVADLESLQSMMDGEPVEDPHLEKKASIKLAALLKKESHALEDTLQKLNARKKNSVKPTTEDANLASIVQRWTQIKTIVEGFENNPNSALS